ncbi:hypothetical protein D3C84_754930 [compost metagenome]
MKKKLNKTKISYSLHEIRSGKLNLCEVKAKCIGVSIATINLGNEYSLTKEVKWLIEQAEKVEKYEKALTYLSDCNNYIDIDYVLDHVEGVAEEVLRDE